MTLQITSVNFATYLQDNSILFNVDCGDVLNIDTRIFNTSRDAANDRLLKTWLLSNTPSTYVEPDPIPLDPVDQTRRSERRDVFAYTLDRMNPLWFTSLTDTQKTNLATWRTTWLDYPETGTKPDDSLIEGIFISDI